MVIISYKLVGTHEAVGSVRIRQPSLASSTTMFKSNPIYAMPAESPRHYQTSAATVGSFLRPGTPFAGTEGQLNNAPSSYFLPAGAAKTPGLNGRTISSSMADSFGQKRTPEQSVKWTPC